jgi:hypothetical protein
LRVLGFLGEEMKGFRVEEIRVLVFSGLGVGGFRVIRVFWVREKDLD